MHLKLKIKQTIQKRKKTDVDCLKEDKREFLKTKKTNIKKRFKSERHNAFTQEINKIPLSSNDNKRIQSIDLLETYETRRDLISKKEKIKRNNIIKQYKNT